jgi:hypothetical protein
MFWPHRSFHFHPPAPAFDQDRLLCFVITKRHSWSDDKKRLEASPPKEAK